MRMFSRTIQQNKIINYLKNLLKQSDHNSMDMHQMWADKCVSSNIAFLGYVNQYEF